MRTALYHHSAHLPDSELSAPLRECVICGSRFTHSRIATIQQSPNVYLLRCRNCHANSVSRMPRADVLNRYYGNYFDPAAPKITHDSPARFARHIASFVREPEKHLAITDFGGGDGTLAYSLARVLCDRVCSSAEITVVDYAASLIPQDRRITVSSAPPHAPVPPSHVILASAVLEHIPDPLASLMKLFAALRPSGILYIRTPAVAGFMRLAEAFGQKLDFTFPAHLHDFGQSFWENLLSLLPDGYEFQVLHSAPSLVETDFRHHPWHTFAAHIAKSPWRLLGRNYTLVGGWEIVFRRK